MKKADYVKQLIDELTAKGIVVNQNQLKSAMAKVALNARNKYGSSNWEYELNESGVSNGIYFYNEYLKKDTWNREMYRQSR